MDLQQEVSDLRDDVHDLKYKVRDLEFWYKRLDDDVKEIKQTIGGFGDKLDATKDALIVIAQDAGARVPKWVMWVAVSFAVPIVGWAVYALLAFMHH